MSVKDRFLPPHVMPMNEARACLSKTTRIFLERGADAEPIFYGSHRRPAGVIMSYERYVQLLDLVDDLAIALEVRKRDREDSGERLSLGQLIRDQGFDLKDLGVE